MYRHPKFLLLLGAVGFSVHCTGEDGAPGAQGLAGPAGPRGADGQNGEDGQNGRDGRDGRDAVLDPGLSPLEKALTALGGRENLENLSSFRLVVAGERSIPLEGYSHDEPPLPASVYTGTITHDIASNGWRREYSRTVVFLGFNAQQRLAEVTLGNLGVVTGQESVFGAPPGPMSSDRWAASAKQAELMNPHVLLRGALEEPSRLTEAGEAILAGALYHVLLLDDPIHPISLYVNVQNGEIHKLSTVESSHFLRDVAVDVYFAGWEATEAGVSFPKEVYLAIDDEILVAENRTTAEANIALESTLFSFPNGSMPQYDATLADRGRRHHHFHTSFAGAGIPLDGIQSFIQPTQVAPGVWHLTGGSHNSLVVEQANGLVLVETPLYQERSEALLAWTRTQFPNKPISHVVISHFHDDHAAGFRSFLTGGAQLVVGENSIPLYRRALRANSTVRPDAYSANPRPVEIVGVPATGFVTLPDAVRPVQIHGVPNFHSDDMVAPFVASAGLLFSSDIFSPGQPPFPVVPGQLYDVVVNRNLAVTTVAGAHGGVGPISELRTAAGR